MKIGFIGAGAMANVLREHLEKAGHQVVLSSPSEERQDGRLIVTPEAAARFGELVILAVPYFVTAKLSPDVISALQDKTVIDLGNPDLKRDGEITREVAQTGKGSGSFTASLLPGAKVVKAFNTINSYSLARNAFHNQSLIGIPVAGDDKVSRLLVSELIKEIGFEPVVIGGIDKAKEFDRGTPLWNADATGDEVRFFSHRARQRMISSFSIGKWIKLEVEAIQS